MWEVKSLPRICKTSYGGKAFSNIFISIYVTLNGFLGQTDMSRWIYRCSQGPWAVHSVQGSVNSILCTGEILTVRTRASKGYIMNSNNFGEGGPVFLIL